MYKLSRQKLNYNSISYDNANVIITTWQHIENPGTAKIVYSDIFRYIQGHSAIFSHVQAY